MAGTGRAEQQETAEIPQQRSSLESTKCNSRIAGLALTVCLIVHRLSLSLLV